MVTMRALEQVDVRSQPQNLEAEMALIGAVLMNNNAYRRVERIITAESFYEELHRRVWTVVSGLIQKGQVANPITCRIYLGDQSIGNNGMTAAQYLARLAAEATGAAAAEDYAQIVRDLALRRKIIAIADTVMANAYDAPVEATADTIISEFESEMMELRQARDENADFQDFGAVSGRAIGMAESAYQRRGGIVGISTGLPNLDAALGGLQPSDLVILAGRPGMGKTALATNVAFNAAKILRDRRAMGDRTGVIGFSSLEMSGEQLSQRILSEQSGVPFWKIRRGIASEQDMEAYVLAQRELRGLPLKIDPTGGLSVGSLRIRARALKKRLGLEILVVDYLQLLSGSGKFNNKRVDDVTEITMGLKALAKELDVPVLALSQLSRRVEERDDKRPMLSDLRESGSIEQDADVVMFVFREEYYLRKQKPREGTEAHMTWERNMRAVTGVAQIIIGKNRHGPESTVTLGFDANTTRFLNEPEEREHEPDEVGRVGRPKKLSMPAEATIAYGVLRSLSIHSRVPTIEERNADRRLHKHARLVGVDLAREKFGHETLGPESSDAEKVRKRFTEAIKPLVKHEVAFYTGKDGAWHIWLPELTRE
jgi:replicative DNA helicase